MMLALLPDLILHRIYLKEGLQKYGFFLSLSLFLNKIYPGSYVYQEIFKSFYSINHFLHWKRLI